MITRGDYLVEKGVAGSAKQLWRAWVLCAFAVPESTPCIAEPRSRRLSTSRREADCRSRSKLDG